MNTSPQTITNFSVAVIGEKIIRDEKGLIPGNHDIEIIAWNVLKNKSSKTIRFAIEN